MRGRDSADLAADLRALGVQPGQHLLVHCSLRSIGQCDGGPQIVLDALREVAGQATIVVPTYTAGNSISSASFRAGTKGFSRARLDRHVAAMQGFDRETTESQDMGLLAEHIRCLPEAVRTGHPQTSFAALGGRADDCTKGHALNERFGASSPLGWLYAHDAAVLLLGVDYRTFSAFHLAEYLLSDHPPRRAYHCFVMEAGERRECELWDVDLDDSDFVAVGRRMDNEPFVRRGRVGDADSRLIPIRRAVEFARTDQAFRERRMGASADPAGSASPARQSAQTVYGAPPPGRYFFLSYARLPPVPPVLPVPSARAADLTDPPDKSVQAFFHDLSAEVSRRAAAGSTLRPGFLAVEDPSGRHWRSGLAEALGFAEVFVPLLSSDYYRRSWPRQEWSGFMQRLRDAGVRDPLRRIAPVLWEPLPAGLQTPELPAALSLASDASLAAYAQNGLYFLQRQRGYRDFYQQVVCELATRIVAIAEKAPLRPSSVWLHEADVPLNQGIGGKVFAVLVTGRRDILTDPASAAQYARLIAERQGYAVQMTEFSASSDQLGAVPGMLLIDAGGLAGEGAGADLDATIACLPSWVLPVVVADWAAGETAMLNMISSVKSPKPYNVRPTIAGDALRGIGSLQEFVALLPRLVAQAEKEYLRHGPIRRSPRPSQPRPRLAGSGSPYEPSVKENPHD